MYSVVPKLGIVMNVSPSLSNQNEQAVVTERMSLREELAARGLRSADHARTRAAAGNVARETRVANPKSVSSVAASPPPHNDEAAVTGVMSLREELAARKLRIKRYDGTRTAAVDATK